MTDLALCLLRDAETLERLARQYRQQVATTADVVRRWAGAPRSAGSTPRP